MPQSDFFPELPDYAPEPADDVSVGESPVPGLTLKHIFQGHKQSIGRIVWSPDGHLLASPSNDGDVRIWNILSGKCIAVLNHERKRNYEHRLEVKVVTWEPNGNRLASGASDGSICIWDTNTWQDLNVLTDHDKSVYSLMWSPDGYKLASGSLDNNLIIWDTKNWHIVKVFEGHNSPVIHLTWSPDGQRIASCGSIDKTVLIWSIKSGAIAHKLLHQKDVRNVLWSKKLSLLISCSDEKILYIWNPKNGNLVKVLEGHTRRLLNLSLSYDGVLLASKSRDNTVRFWFSDTWENVATLDEPSKGYWFSGLAFHPTQSYLASVEENKKIIRIWSVNTKVLLRQANNESIHYTTAKIVLVGDSGVGKTGLGWRLAHNNFQEHASTHGQQFWKINDLCKTRNDGTECEAVLWDLAGQPDYRLVHSLFLDDVDTALVLFDPTNRQDPLSGVDFWLNQLRQKDQNLCSSILVGARTDRGTSTLTVEELQAYCERNGIQGGYISTSAVTGDGLSELLEQLKEQIPWDEMTATVTTQTFKRIKEYILGLKEQTDRTNVLVHPKELRAQLQESDPDWDFSDAEMMTAVGHLATHGFVTVLKGSHGGQSILLTPNLLANLASSIVLEARRNQRGLGVLEENRLLAGDYHFPELHDLDKEERETLLDAAAVLFLDHNLCFRETFNQQSFLVFPSLINEKRPKDKNVAFVEDASYQVKGAVENVYASLVVLLGYTNTFIRTNQWQNQAQYEVGKDEICGFQQTNNQDGEIELLLYYGDNTPEPAKLMFRGMFERFLSRRDLEISRYQPVVCTKCGVQLARNVVMAQLSRGRDFSFCNDCGIKLSLQSPEPLTRLSKQDEKELDIQQAVAERRTNFETALVRVKALLRDRGETPRTTCFISYAWGVSEHERWVLQLARDLRNADIDVLLDRWQNAPGAVLDRYIEKVLDSEFVIVVGTPKLRQKYTSKTSDSVVTAELELINLRLRQPAQYGRKVLPLLVDGEPDTAFTPQLLKLINVDFRNPDFYFRRLFDMIWRIYNLPLDHPLLEELQASMSPKAM